MPTKAGGAAGSTLAPNHDAASGARRGTGTDLGWIGCANDGYAAVYSFRVVWSSLATSLSETGGARF